ncbi:helix-turn-helix domain-containing protein [Coraliomargarita akajimensis]|uniref:Transcriptional regulator, AraC family n=1 Tax=Coraliomargarita akajimensis (strain DSM 45221 / IAM 15411 / JCM 23193 / KCTC 12865 / 04OKA010-24) TaxID=583355 RepID=D5EI88_CORAD|nr:AraC family transcriptional regulator [Coraliomargarita akajimensis]ADE56128.1 transcriptional regulator, AraC family [Coraliomargarita akajimensis DSM 45221]
MLNRSNSLRLGYLYGGEVAYQAGESLATRTLTDYEIAYIINGTVRYSANDTSYVVPAGGIIIGHKGTVETYTWSVSQETRHAYFHFSIEQLPNDWPSPDQWPRVIEKPQAVSVALFQHVIKRIYQQSDWAATSPSARDSLLLETLIDTLLEAPGPMEHGFERDRPEPVRRGLKWMRQQIDERADEAFTLSDIARAAGCSSKYLCRSFKSSMGHTPMQTNMLMRMQLSLNLLAKTNLSIAEIAQRCGYTNPLYFSRCFSKTCGRSPRQVRHDLREGKPPPSIPLPVDVIPRLQ